MVLEFVKDFSSSMEIFVSQLVYIVDYIDGFTYVEQTMNDWDEASWIMVDEFSDMF